MIRFGSFRRPFAVCALVLAGCAAAGTDGDAFSTTDVAFSTTSSPAADSTTTSIVVAPPTPEHTIGLFGDSLAWEAGPYYERLLVAAGTSPVKVDTFGGTAICDMLDDMRTLVAYVHFSTVQISFSGNALTPCMEGYAYGSEAYFSKYREDALEAVAIFAAAGARVQLVAPPVMDTPASNGGEVQRRLALVYRSIAITDPSHVTFVDAGAAVETRDGAFTRTLPCLAGETCDGPVVAGVRTNIVRSSDGVHFCPVATGNAAGIVEQCPVHSSGAQRYAAAMVAALSASVG